MKNPIVRCYTFILLITILVSCKKSSQPETPYSTLYGKWKITQEAIDDSKTGILDSNKFFNLPSNDIEFFTFNKDSSGVHYIKYNGEVNNYNFRWSLINNFADIRIISFINDTTVAHIVSNYGATLIIRNNTSPLVSWYYLQKQ